MDAFLTEPERVERVYLRAGFGKLIRQITDMHRKLNHGSCIRLMNDMRRAAHLEWYIDTNGIPQRRAGVHCAIDDNRTAEDDEYDPIEKSYIIVYHAIVDAYLSLRTKVGENLKYCTIEDGYAMMQIKQTTFKPMTEYNPHDIEQAIKEIDKLYHSTFSNTKCVRVELNKQCEKLQAIIDNQLKCNCDHN
jgi:hypothetical protein